MPRQNWFVLSRSWLFPALCFGSLSCWRTRGLRLRPSCLTPGCTFRPRMHWQSWDFIVPCTDSRHPVPDVTKQPQKILAPPPRFTLVFFSLCASFFASLNIELMWPMCCQKAPVLSHLSRGHSPRSFVAGQHAFWQISVSLFLWLAFNSDVLLGRPPLRPLWCKRRRMVWSDTNLVLDVHLYSLCCSGLFSYHS